MASNRDYKGHGVHIIVIKWDSVCVYVNSDTTQYKESVTHIKRYVYQAKWIDKEWIGCTNSRQSKGIHMYTYTIDTRQSTNMVTNTYTHTYMQYTHTTHSEQKQTMQIACTIAHQRLIISTHKSFMNTKIQKLANVCVCAYKHTYMEK